MNGHQFNKQTKEESSVKQYVTGFLFSEDLSHVVLIEKLAPEWQRGYCNGVGGKIEAGETPLHAMSREFEEETGVHIAPELWRCYAKIDRPDIYHLDVFMAVSDLAFEAKTVEKEKVVICRVSSLPENLIPNLKWLVPMALDQELEPDTPVLCREVATQRTTV